MHLCHHLQMTTRPDHWTCQRRHHQRRQRPPDPFQLNPMTRPQFLPDQPQARSKRPQGSKRKRRKQASQQRPPQATAARDRNNSCATSQLASASDAMIQEATVASAGSHAIFAAMLNASHVASLISWHHDIMMATTGPPAVATSVATSHDGHMDGQRRQRSPAATASLLSHHDEGKECWRLLVYLSGRYSYYWIYQRSPATPAATSSSDATKILASLAIATSMLKFSFYHTNCWLLLKFLASS